ncbi:molybdopterin-binding protein [Clostridiaceae bacterium 35-E11]
MKKVRVEDALGMVLAHDLTKIVPGKFKGAAFKKGHIIQKEDIEELKNMGKNHINIIELDESNLHEDESALRIGKAVAGEGIYMEGPSEGKVTLKAKYKGLLKIDVEALALINGVDQVMLATLHNNSLVKEGQTVAGTRIIPLTIQKSSIESVENICDKLNKVVSVKALQPMKVGIVVTGTEVYKGRITDRFGPVLEEKVHHYGGKIIGMQCAPDDVEKIEEAIQRMIDQGAKVVLTSGGMSVDADDVTPVAIRKICSEVITYGSPVLPGAMLMLAYNDKATILGVPACGMYHKITVLDLVFPRVLAGEVLSKKEIASLGHGGLCLNCEFCHFPVCPLGK